MTPKRREVRHGGSIAVLAAVLMIPLSLFLAVVVDAARVWVAREALQNGVESAAASATIRWVQNGTACAPDTLAVASSDDAAPSKVDCAVTGDRHSGTLHVAARQNVNLLFGALVGRETAAVTASTTTRTGATRSATGLWPFALCSEHPALQQWIAGGMTSASEWTISFSTNVAACGLSTGNWTLLDFNGGSNSTSETNSWISGGYQGTVHVGDIVPGNTGAPSSSIKLDAAVGNDVALAFFDHVEGTGSGTNYRIAGFARAHVVSVTLSGSSANRSITLVFKSGLNSSGVGSGPNLGLTSWKVCAIDSKGTCT